MNLPPSLEVWYQQAQVQAQRAQISFEELNFLLRGVTGLDRLHLHVKVSPEQLTRLATLWQQRLDTGMPIQYLVGVVTWRDFELYVAPGVLIPRPETELLVEYVAALLPTKEPLWLVDVGTGSGCLALGLARLLPNLYILAIDSSPIALELAQRNIEHLQRTAQIQLLAGNWLEPITHPVDVLISNPPYIPTVLIPQLDSQVRDHEPHLALDGGADGLTAFRILVTDGARVLKPGGLWAVETMQGQEDAVLQLLADSGAYTDLQTQPDLEGNARFVLARRRPSALCVGNEAPLGIGECAI